MGREISEEELKNAREKLACHIEPQKFSSGTDGATLGGSSSAAPVSSDQCFGPNGEVFLTRMTAAGG